MWVGYTQMRKAMSKGNPKILVRVPTELLTEIAMVIESANIGRKEEPYTLSSWVRHCIDAKLRHLRRSKTKRV